ncbi:MAG: ketoacyl-ACP synthase III [Prevotella sp.]|nr:ketoacyl-ACP synthase III [Prevotella sp.]
MKSIIKNVEIKSIVTCLPEGIKEMSSFADVFGEKVVADTIKTSGIERVHVAKQDETTSDLCYQAAESLIEKEGIDKTSIDGLIFVSLTPDYAFPATSVVLQGRLGLSKDIVAFDTIYGCSGYIYGVFQAATLIGSGACKNVLLLAGDTNSKILDQNEKSNAMVFGDAGSATLISQGKSSLAFDLHTNGFIYDTVINKNSGYRSWPANLDEKFNEQSMRGDDVFSFIVSHGPKTIKAVLELVEWDKDDVDFYGLHQATKVTIDFMRMKLKLAHPERAPFDIENYGNTGPVTVPLVLTDYPYRAEGIDTSKWKKVILSAYGVGMSWGSIACDLSQTHIYRPINQ